MKKKETNKYIAFHEKPHTIIDLANMVEWKDVRKAWEYLYPEYKPNKYKKVFVAIQKYPKRKQKDKDERFEIYIAGERDWKDGISSEEQIKDYLKTFGFEEYYGCATNKFSLSFRKWKEASNLLVSEETIKNNLVPEILAHFIWEITWYGMEKEMDKKGKEMAKSFKEFMKDIKKEKKK